MDILNFSCTYTTKFILPLLLDEQVNHIKLFNESFINAYIADLDHPEYNDKIHLYFADYPSLSIQKHLPETVAEFQYKDGYVFIYNLPIQYWDDYLKILQGDYSKLSDAAKVKILDFWQADESTLLWGVLYKKGDKVREFYRDKLDRNLNEISPSAEWWLAPRIETEVIGRLE